MSSFATGEKLSGNWELTFSRGICLRYSFPQFLQKVCCCLLVCCIFRVYAKIRERLVDILYNCSSAVVYSAANFALGNSFRVSLQPFDVVQIGGDTWGGRASISSSRGLEENGRTEYNQLSQQFVLCFPQELTGRGDRNVHG